MTRFVQSEDRIQGVLLPEYLDDYVAEDNPVRVIDVFVDELDLGALGFDGVIPEATGRPAYHPGALLKIYVYGYINQIASSRRLERETHRNVELMWLTGRLTPDFKTIADFRKDNGPAIRGACRQFIALCRQLGLFAHAVAAIDGSKFKAANARDKNFTKASIQRRMEQVEASIERYMAADRQDGELAPANSVRLKDKIAALKACSISPPGRSATDFTTTSRTTGPSGCKMSRSTNASRFPIQAGTCQGFVCRRRGRS